MSCAPVTEKAEIQNWASSPWAEHFCTRQPSTPCSQACVHQASKWVLSPLHLRKTPGNLIPRRVAAIPAPSLECLRPTGLPSWCNFLLILFYLVIKNYFHWIIYLLILSGVWGISISLSSPCPHQILPLPQVVSNLFYSSSKNLCL